LWRASYSNDSEFQGETKVRIMIAGASGLVGTSVARLLADWHPVLIGRRDVAGAGEPLVGPPAEWPSLIARYPVDVAICTLGTTIRIAGSQQAFAAVDRDLVIGFAKAVRKAGARQFMMISSVGASAESRNFYLRTKGEAEAGVTALGFERVDIFRPGLLRGDRGGAPRLGERIGIALSPITDLLTPFVLDQYRSIAAADVAAAMAQLVGAGEGGVFVHHNREIMKGNGLSISKSSLPKPSAPSN
jgi:uncharacterized protein YbjT (DUF2867 family)